LIQCFYPPCHEIFENGAVQQAQQNYKVAAALIGLLMAPCGSAGAASIVHHPTPPNPLLSDGKPGPCDRRLGQPDDVSEVDVAGNPVAPAAVPAPRSPVPAEVLVPLGGPMSHRGGGSIAALDGQALEPLLNPAPHCAPKPR
jgi:hypothetical protein